MHLGLSLRVDNLIERGQGRARRSNRILIRNQKRTRGGRGQTLTVLQSVALGFKLRVGDIPLTGFNRIACHGGLLIDGIVIGNIRLIFMQEPWIRAWRQRIIRRRLGKTLKGLKDHRIGRGKIQCIVGRQRASMLNLGQSWVR